MVTRRLSWLMLAGLLAIAPACRHHRQVPDTNPAPLADATRGSAKKSWIVPFYKPTLDGQFPKPGAARSDAMVFYVTLKSRKEQEELFSPLLMDSGSTGTVFYMPQSTVAGIMADNPDDAEWGTATVADGREVRVLIVHGVRVAIRNGPWAKLDAIQIIPYPDDQYTFMRDNLQPLGLLGMDFMKQFEFSVDYKKQEVTFRQK